MNDNEHEKKTRQIDIEPRKCLQKGKFLPNSLAAYKEEGEGGQKEHLAEPEMARFTDSCPKMAVK